jgi:hypothetical protein
MSFDFLNWLNSEGSPTALFFVGTISLYWQKSEREKWVYDSLDSSI